MIAGVNHLKHLSMTLDRNLDVIHLNDSIQRATMNQITSSGPATRHKARISESVIAGNVSLK